MACATQALNYSPQTSLDEGVRRFAEWFTEYYGAALEPGAVQPQDWVSGCFLADGACMTRPCCVMRAVSVVSPLHPL